MSSVPVPSPMRASRGDWVLLFRMAAGAPALRGARFCALRALGVVIRKWPSANSSIEANSLAVLPSPHVFTSIFMASLAFCSSSQLPTMNFEEGFAPSGNFRSWSLLSLSQATKPIQARAMKNE